jgi:hypothetical protein
VRLQESNTSQSNETRRGRRTYGAQLLYLAVLLAAAQMVHAQSSILGTNLIVNGNAEAGPAGTGVNDIVTSIPGWTRAGNINVLSYGLTGLVLLTDPAPPRSRFSILLCRGQQGNHLHTHAGN